MSVFNNKEYVHSPEVVNNTNNSKHKTNKQGKFKLKTLFQPFTNLIKESGIEKTVEKTAKFIKEMLPEELLLNYNTFSKNNRFSMSDLSKIADKEQYIDAPYLFTKGVAHIKQPKSSMCNFITLPKEKKPHKVAQQYLVSSAPKKSKKVPIFWKNVLKSNSRIIVSVLQPKEKNTIKSLPYWNTEQFGIKNITKLEETVLQEGVKKTQLIRRIFLVENDDKTTYQIQQFHYDGWLDCKKAPDIQLFSRLLQEVRAQDEGVHPVTVHCAAGVGRSSAFVFSYFLYKKLLEKNSAFKSESKNLNENTEEANCNNAQATEEKEPVESDEPKYNLLKYIFEGMTQRKSFGSKRQLTTITKGALEAFKNTQDK